MCAAVTFPAKAHAFEPSTWAEVEDAATLRKEAASRLARGSDPIIPDVLSFTDCPARCIHADLPDATLVPRHAARKRPRGPAYPTRPSDRPPLPLPASLGLTRPPAGPDTPHPPRRVKRSLAHAEDVLGLGRVDLAAARFVRRYTPEHPAPNVAPSLPPATTRPLTPDDDSDDPAELASAAINPSSPAFDSTLYLARLHVDSSIADLRRGLDTLHLVADDLVLRAAASRASSHASLALAAAVVEQSRRLVQEAPAFRRVMQAAGSDGAKFFDVGVNLDETYRHVLERQCWIDCLKQAQAVYSRFPWLFRLPASLRAAGKADVATVEETAALVLRVREWISAQDSDPHGPGRAWIQRELSAGLEEFISFLTSRLSRSARNGEEESVPRLVAVLEFVDRADVIEICLRARLESAKEVLLKFRRPRVNLHMRTRTGTNDTSSAMHVADSVKRLSSSFIDGLSDYWALARVIMKRRAKWQDKVDQSLPTLVAFFVDALQHVLASGPREVASKDAAVEVGHAYRRAVRDVNVPKKYLLPVQSVGTQLVDTYLALLTRSVKSSAKSITRRCFETETVGGQLPVLAHILVEETIGEARDLVEMERRDFLDVDDGGRAADPDSDLHALAVACVRVPEFVVRRLRALVAERSRGCHILGGSSVASSSLISTAASSQSASETNQTPTNQSNLSDAYGSCVLGTARCCNEFLGGKGIEMIVDCVRDVHWNPALSRQTESVTKRIRIVACEVVRVYCKKLSPEVRWSARRIPELQSMEGLRTSHSMEIESASSQATEVLFNISLAVCRARRLGATTRELHLIEKEFTEQIADVLVTAMSASSSNGTQDMVAQIWVDIDFLMSALRDIHGSHSTTGKARDCFLQARDIAAAAIRAGGFAFGTAEEETLRCTAVEPSVARAKLVRQAISGQCAKRVLSNWSWMRNFRSEGVIRSFESSL